MASMSASAFASICCCVAAASWRASLRHAVAAPNLCKAGYLKLKSWSASWLLSSSSWRALAASDKVAAKDYQDPPCLFLPALDAGPEARNPSQVNGGGRIFQHRVQLDVSVPHEEPEIGLREIKNISRRIDRNPAKTRFQEARLFLGNKLLWVLRLEGRACSQKGSAVPLARLNLL